MTKEDDALQEAIIDQLNAEIAAAGLNMKALAERIERPYDSTRNYPRKERAMPVLIFLECATARGSAFTNQDFRANAALTYFPNRVDQRHGFREWHSTSLISNILSITIAPPTQTPPCQASPNTQPKLGGATESATANPTAHKPTNGASKPSALRRSDQPTTSPPPETTPTSTRQPERPPLARYSR